MTNSLVRALCLAGLLVVLVSAHMAAASGGVVVLLGADDGRFSGVGELKYILDVMTQVVNRTDQFVYCQSVYEGNLSKISVVAVTTGIKSVMAAVCLQEVIAGLRSESRNVSLVMNVGTSGWSPVVGGLDPLEATGAGCSVDKRPPLETVSLGSVCVSNIAYDMGCGFKIENETKGECWYGGPQQEENVAMFGQCSYANAPGGKVVEDILAANNGTIRLRVPSNVTKSMKTWWSEMQLGPINSSLLPWNRAPVMTSKCAEADGSDIWVGARGDFECRRRSAYLQARWNASTGATTAADTVCVSAMEAFGMMRVTQPLDIPTVLVRGMSNYDMLPLRAVSSRGGNASSPLWMQDAGYASEANKTRMAIIGYQWAVRTTNEVVLKYLSHL